MNDKAADLRRVIRDLEGDLERAHNNFERAIGIISGADENDIVEVALEDFAWEINQAIKTLKRQLAHEVAS